MEVARSRFDPKLFKEHSVEDVYRAWLNEEEVIVENPQPVPQSWLQRLQMESVCILVSTVVITFVFKL